MNYRAGSDRRTHVRPAGQAEDDDTLLLRLKSGDREALGVLFVRYARLVMSVGMRVLHDVTESEDLVHDVFILLLNKVELFDPKRGSARAWLAKNHLSSGIGPPVISDSPIFL